jgi:hypothetical protein
MSTLERELLCRIDGYKAGSGGLEPLYVNVLIRWKDSGKVEPRTVALFPYDENKTPDHIDERVFFYFDLASNIMFCLSYLEISVNDFDTIEEFETELNKYAETEEDALYYFPSREDFDIVSIEGVGRELY